jgi:hypothetical protein
MDDDKKIKQPNNNIDNNEDYQKILDKYADSVKPEDSNPQNLTPTPEPNPTAKLEEVDNKITEDEKVKLKDINSSQLESGQKDPSPVGIPVVPPQNTESEDKVDQDLSPIPESKAEEKLSTETLPPTDKTTKEPVINPTSSLAEEESAAVGIKPEAEIASSINPPPTEDISQVEEKLESKSEELPKDEKEVEAENSKTPEEIKAEIDEILTDEPKDQSIPAETNNKPKSGGLKGIFIISLIIFFLIAGAWAYFLFFYQPVTNQNSTTTSITPTEVIVQETCELNDEIYQIGESFSSVDGCNTCVCQSADIISCTEMACTISPAVTNNPSTQSAAISPTEVTIIPTKSATSSTTTSPSL